MMDISLVAAAATPFLAKGADAFIKIAGEKAAGKIADLCQTVENKLKGDSSAEQMLTRAREKPESKGRQTALEGVLAEKMEDDPVFAENVRKLVEEAKREAASASRISNQQGQTVHGPQTNING
ncbi:MAG TPA: hypothetical protein VN455_06120, partial [Methanotrichaceae archaeon]|nr:hypothetical protein [Methanotrichaceae archaeon]